MAQKKVAGKKTAGGNKRGPKAKQVEEEKPEMDVEASEDDSEASDEENDITDSQVKGAADLVDSETEEDDDDEDEDDDEEDDDDDDEVEPGQISISKDAANQADSDSDGEPDEAPIDKKKEPKAGKKGGIPKVNVGRIPPGTPHERQIFISQMPTEYKHQDLVALFAKFGAIAVVNRIKTKAGGNNVAIAFESEDSVEAILAAKPKALTLNGQVLNVSRPLKRDDLNLRTIIIGLIGAATTTQQITEHFKSCGEVESVNFTHNKAQPSAYLRFKSADAMPKALKLNGTEFNSRFITVRVATYNAKALKSPECTLTVSNTGEHESFKYDVLEKIFKKHGDLTDVDIVCTRSILGFVTYQTAEQAQKAKKALDGKTVGELEIKLEPFNYASSVRTILVTNLANGVQEEELRGIFSASGEIENVTMLTNKAIIRFTTDDGFCKSFLLNERIVQSQPIFIEPNSNIKHKILQNKLRAKNPNFKFNQKPAGAPAKFQKFGNSSQPNNKYNNNNNKKPFNKRRAQENGSGPKSFKKTKTA